MSVCRSKCCEHVPQDIFLEIWEEIGFPESPDYTQIWLLWAESQLGGGVTALTDHSLSVDRLRAHFPGPWGAHTHGHQLIVSTFRVSGSRLIIGQADGSLQLYTVMEPSFVRSVNIEDGSVREVELWHSEQLVAVAGDTLLHVMEVDTLREVSIPDIELCGDNKHISCFGEILSYCDLKSDIIVCSFVKPRERYGDNPFNRLFSITTRNASPIQWKIWGSEVIVLDTQGTVLVYTFFENIIELVFQSESNVMILYKNPCHMFRDVILCSTSAAAGLIVRASYWLLGWRLQDTGGKLHRAMEQDKISPQEEVWALAIRRNLVLCGTEGGVLMLFSNDETDDQSSNYQAQALKGNIMPHANFVLYHRQTFPSREATLM